jgi:hypothetical protein
LRDFIDERILERFYWIESIGEILLDRGYERKFIEEISLMKQLENFF